MKKWVILLMLMFIFLSMPVISHAAVSDFEIQGTTLVSYKGSGGDVIVPDGITVIGRGAFAVKRDISSVTLPSSVTRIEDSAFGNTGFNLRDSHLIVNIPENVTYIGAHAFSQTTLASITIPEGVTYIGESIFYQTQLTDITIPKSITAIPKDAFKECSQLKSVTLHDQITTIGEGAFKYCTSLESIDLPASLTSIEHTSFTYCTSLKSITIPSSVKIINTAAFMGCSNLSHVTLSEGLEVIKTQAFQSCHSLGEIIIPTTVKEIDLSAFGQSENVIVNIYENSLPHKAILDYFDKYPKIVDHYQKILKVLPAYNIKFDTASDWAKSELESAVNAGLTSDKVVNDFGQQITREEFCEIIMKLYDKLGGKGIQTVDNPFNDTNNGAIIRAYNAGIVNGTGANTFSPDGNLTREQLCVMIVNALGKANKPLDKSLDFQKTYSDENKISDWAKQSIKILNGYKVFNGDGSQLNPGSYITREQGILLLKRSYELFKDN